MSGTEIWLVRHGETAWNADGRWQGHTDTELSPAGLKQARRLAERLRGQGFAAVYTSDLRRAAQTAVTVAAALAGRPPVVEDARLREIHVGEMAGLTTAEGVARGIFRRPMAFDEPFPGGESRAAQVGRVTDALREVAERHRNGRVLAVGHGGTVGAGLSGLLGIDEETYQGVFGRLANVSITRLRQNEDGSWRVLVFNDTAHLEGAAVASRSEPVF
ncbi:MAG TPA: histidine phosphatase family protein [Candidatus Thermoplasmatota archaeon]|nr:histidine phosphatase family protein [Candidatus Thermoplasmatota archaeon]